MPWVASTAADGMKRSGCSLMRPVGVVAAGPDADHGLVDAEAVEVVEHDRYGIDVVLEVGGHVLEHVLRREPKALALVVPR